MQSTLQHNGLHVGIIMDGNGRWAKHRGLPRAFGHRAGVDTVGRIVDAAPQFGISTITLFAFSCDNWRRPPEEVDTLMSLIRIFLTHATKRFLADNMRLTFIGRRDRVPPRLLDGIRHAEAATSRGKKLHIRIALDYSARDAIARVFSALATKPPPGDMRDAINEALTGPDNAGQVDLLIRTGGEKRLSDFLLWESAYAELWFTDIMWPDFDAEALSQAVTDFQSRERRFGALPRKSVSVA